MCWGAKQRIDIQLSKLRFETIINVFVSRLVLALTSCLANLCLTAASLFEIWAPAWSSAKPVAFTEKFLVLFLSSLGLFSFLLFPFFSPRTFFRFWFFHEKRFPRVNCKVCDVNKIWKNVKIELQHERLPRKFPQGIHPGSLQSRRNFGERVLGNFITKIMAAFFNLMAVESWGEK